MISCSHAASLPGSWLSISPVHALDLRAHLAQRSFLSLVLSFYPPLSPGAPSSAHIHVRTPALTHVPAPPHRAPSSSEVLSTNQNFPTELEHELELAYEHECELKMERL